MKINVPNVILSPEEIQALRPNERENYIRALIKNILTLNENGVMASEIVEATNLNRVTVMKHLELLVAIREAYKKDRGTGAIYYINGRLVHPTDRFFIVIRDKIYDFVKLENAEGEFIFIQEKEQDELRLTTIKGGIMIRRQDFLQFMDGLQKFMILSETKAEARI